MNIKYERKINASFNDATDILKKKLEENKFSVLWELNFKDKLREKGLEFNTNFKIFEVCNAPQAKEILSNHIEVGYFLPCKMVIYEKDNSVFAGMLKPVDLMQMMGKDDLIDIAQEVENTLINVLDAL